MKINKEELEAYRESSLSAGESMPGTTASEQLGSCKAMLSYLGNVVDTLMETNGASDAQLDYFIPEYLKGVERLRGILLGKQPRPVTQEGLPTMTAGMTAACIAGLRILEVFKDAERTQVGPILQDAAVTDLASLIPKTIEHLQYADSDLGKHREIMGDIRTTLEDFEAMCKESEYTDTDHLWSFVVPRIRRSLDEVST